MARISEEVVNEVLQKTDLVDLVSEKVTLSKQGKSYFGLCPFHSEKTPSFSVEPEKKIYTCFSCGEKGNAITFKQKTDNMTFVDAVEELADRADIQIDFSEYKRENPNKKYYEINNDAKGFYKLFLSNTVQGKDAVNYLKDRHITQEIIDAFDIGLAPTGFDLLYKTLSEKGYLVSDMFDLGLVKKSKNDNFYDLFRERIIFPIHDVSGNVVAFSGRVYKEGDENAKYINSPQTVVFTKSNVLYNLHHALNEIKRTKRVVLFEGYMDVIAAYRAGIKDSVASMGTSLTRDQVRLIKRYANEVTICYDGDSAGVEAASRALELLHAEKINVKIVILPNNLDPDDYINKYSEKALNEYINQKWYSSIRFLYMKHKSAVDFTKMLDIEQFKKAIFNLIKGEPRTTIEVFLKEIADDSKLSIESVKQDFEQYTKKTVSVRRSNQSQKIPIMSKYEIAERRLINYFLEDKKYLMEYNKEIGEDFFIDSNVRDLKHVIEDNMYYGYRQDGSVHVDVALFLDKLSEEQLHFYDEHIKSKMVELSDAEFHDLIEAMNEYKIILQSKDDEERMKKAETLEEKIAIAKRRDQKLKEVKHGQR